jgi:hypothetical protein
MTATADRPAREPGGLSPLVGSLVVTVGGVELIEIATHDPGAGFLGLR